MAAPATEDAHTTVAGPATLLVPHGGALYLGLHDPELARRTLRSVTEELGARPVIVHWFQQWRSGESRFRPDWARAVARQGAVPLITWEPWAKPNKGIATPNQPDISLARIVAGDFDGYIRQWARAAARYGQPVFVRPMHEMNGHWYPWAVKANGNRVEDFAPAWRHIVDIFRQERADNVLFVWSVNNDAGAGRLGALDGFYPGDRYVDWVATSAFNWGDSYDWSDWRSAQAILAPTYRALSRYGKPIMVSELGTVDGERREAWIKDAVQSIRSRMPRIKAVVWYSARDAAGIDFRVRGLPGVLKPPIEGATWFAPLRLKPRVTRTTAARTTSNNGKASTGDRDRGKGRDRDED